MNDFAVLNYGGGRQTTAIVVMILRGVIERPAKILMADTGRENQSTWDYLDRWVAPALARIGMSVDIVRPPKLPVLTYGSDDKPLLPVFVEGGTMSPFCSGQWKRDRMNSYLASVDWPACERWIGFAMNERRRINRMLNSERADKYTYRFPLVEHFLTTADCLEVVRNYGWPEPSVSSCWMCPHKKNREWRTLRDSDPQHWEEACEIDEQLREDDLERGGAGVWLHHSRVPLRQADLSIDEPEALVRQCSLGTCFI